MRRVFLMGLGLLATGAAWAVPVEDLSHGQEGALHYSMDATRPLVEQVARLRTQVEGLRQLDLPSQLETLQETVARLNGQVESQAHQLAALQEKGRASQAKPKEVTTDTASALYLKGLQAMKKEDFKAAEGFFKTLIQADPKNTLVPEAYYWLAIACMSDQSFAPAKKAMNAFLASKDHPLDKEPSAWLNLGLIAEQLGNNAEAKTLFGRLVKNYPVSKEAVSAKKMLKDLGAS